MADLKTTTIYGDAYINNKVGINTNTPATRLQIGQLSPTAATEGLQFGDDTGTRIYRSASGTLSLSGNVAGLTLSASTALYGNYGDWSGEANKIQWHSNNLYIQNGGGGSWCFRNGNGVNVTTIDTAGVISTSGNISTSGYAYSSYVNTSDDTSSTGITYIMAKFGDNFHRSANASKVAAFLSGQAFTGSFTGSLSGNVTGNAGTVTNGLYTTSNFLLGTTTIALNRTSSAQTLTGISIDGSAASCTGNAGSVSDGVYLSTNQTITGVKTFNTMVQLTGVKESMSAVTISSSTVTINLNTSSVFKLTFNGTVNSFNVNNVTANKTNSFTLITEAAAGAATITWNFSNDGAAAVAVKWAGSLSPAATTTSTKIDVYSFVYDGSNWYGFTGGRNY